MRETHGCFSRRIHVIYGLTGQGHLVRHGFFGRELEDRRRRFWSRVATSTSTHRRRRCDSPTDAWGGTARRRPRASRAVPPPARCSLEIDLAEPGRRPRARTGQFVHDGLASRSDLTLRQTTVSRCAPWLNRAVSVTVVNPATEETIATLPRRGSRRPTRRLLGLARRSRPGGRSRRATAARLLRGSRRSSRSTREELARIESQNVGKPISGARGEVGMVARRLPLLRRRRRQAPRRDDPRRRRRRPDVPRAARRRRPHRPLELPAQHRVLEARPGARLRQHGRAQAGRADPALRAPPRRARARGRHPRGRRQRRRRQGLGRRPAPRRAPRRREDRLHRLDRGRPRRHAGRRRRRSSA